MSFLRHKHSGNLGVSKKKRAETRGLGPLSLLFSRSALLYLDGVFACAGVAFGEAAGAGFITVVPP